MIFDIEIDLPMLEYLSEQVFVPEGFSAETVSFSALTSDEEQMLLQGDQERYSLSQERVSKVFDIGFDLPMLEDLSEQVFVPEGFSAATVSFSALTSDEDQMLLQSAVSYEPNNTLSQAVQVGKGTLDVNGQGEDWYKISVGSGAISLTMTPQTGTDVNMVLHNAMGQVISANFQSGQESISYNTSSAGDYFIKIEPTSGTTSAYTLAIDYMDAPLTQFEPNNSIAAAKVVGKETLNVDGIGEDWFKISVGPGNISLTMTPQTGTDVNMVLHNSAGQVVATNFQPGQEIISHNALSVEDYFIKLEPTSGTTSSYTLAIDYADGPNNVLEPNNVRGQAVTLSEGTVQVQGSGEDWFKFNANPGLIELSMTPETGAGRDVNMILYDSAGTILKSDFQVGTETIQYYSNVSDEFFVQLVPTASNVGLYSLSLDLPENSWAVTLPFGPVNNASIGLYDIDDDGKEEIVVGTSKLIDAAGNETRPAGLIVLEDTGAVKWTYSFPAMTTPDPDTGKVYNTTSVSSPPTFSDLDGDGNVEILVGLGANTAGQFENVVGQPGDKGGLAALDRDGNLIWFKESLDIIGGPENVGDGRPDGVHGAASVFDIDRDGKPEVIYNGWDQRTWILDGATGNVEGQVELLDTAWSNVRIADLNRDNLFEILVTADITENADAGTQTGGLFHVFNADLTQTLPGFDAFIGNPNYETLKGKFEDQPLWSSPITGDLDGDGELEIAYGTGNFFKEGQGEFITVWNNDGSLLFRLDTNGRTFSTPIMADIDGDGDQELIATTVDGYIHGWDHNGTSLFATETLPFGTFDASGVRVVDANGQNLMQPIFGSPIAIDLDGDNKLEIIYAQGAQMIVVNSLGQQVSSPTLQNHIFTNFTGGMAAKDIDNDGRLEIISGGTTNAGDQAVIYRWDNPLTSQGTTYRDAGYQFHQSLTNIDEFVERFYQEILGREAEARGNTYWNDSLYNGTRSGADVGLGFVFSQEFLNRGVDDNTYIDILYKAFFDRNGDIGGRDYWRDQFTQGATRLQVFDGFVLSQEFSNLALRYSIRPT